MYFNYEAKQVKIMKRVKLDHMKLLQNVHGREVVAFDPALKTLDKANGKNGDKKRVRRVLRLVRDSRSYKTASKKYAVRVVRK